jgi:hypothetical protein
MAGAGLDCLFLTSEKNIRYVSGFHSQTWVSPTRSRFVILPREGAPVAIAPHTNVPGFRATSWIEDVRGWPAPRPADDGVSLIVDALQALVKPGGRVGAELGPEMRLEMPAADFARIGAGLDGRRFVDAGPVLRPVRMVKSEPELVRARRIGEIASEAFARLAPQLRPGLSEREIYSLHHRLLVELGADKVPYLDSAWDAVHTFIRIPAGAVLMAAAVADVDPSLRLAAGLIGGSLALTTHSAKATARLAANTSPEPFSNVVLSTVEDVATVFLLGMAASHPILAGIALIIVLGICVALLYTCFKFTRMFFAKLSRSLSPPTGSTSSD